MDVVAHFQRFPKADFFLVKKRNYITVKAVEGTVIFSYISFELINIEIKRVLPNPNEGIDFINE